MNIRIGLIPYLNMVPFHHGFGPAPIDDDGRFFEFDRMSPRVLGLEAEKGTIDAGALSLVDWLNNTDQFEPLGNYGIGLKRPAQSVLLFSKVPLSQLRGICAVTDDTSTSFRLLQVLLEVRYNRFEMSYGRIASSILFDGVADALLLIGDEALEAKSEGLPGFPVVTDLGEEWFAWQKLPFVFARWAVRSALRQEVKDRIELFIENSLKTSERNQLVCAKEEAIKRGLQVLDVNHYWNGFIYRLTPNHERSISIFAGLLGKVYA